MGDSLLTPQRKNLMAPRGFSPWLIRYRGKHRGIMQIGGWKREAMPTRYIGKYDASELKEFPTAGLREVLAAR